MKNQMMSKKKLTRLLLKRNNLMSVESYIEAKNKFLSGDYLLAEDYFKQNGFVLEYGYCKLLSGEIASAKTIFKTVSDQDLRADWAYKLIQFIEGYVVDVPSYFQVRNFLEIDLNLLIEAAQPAFVENIINGADLFYSVNPESYKFIGRVMLFNNFDDIALHYLKKAKDKFYYDPEMHLMMANCYINSGDKPLAKTAINCCLGMLPNYYPAKKLLETIR